MAAAARRLWPRSHQNASTLSLTETRPREPNLSIDIAVAQAETSAGTSRKRRHVVHEAQPDPSSAPADPEPDSSPAQAHDQSALDSEEPSHKRLRRSFRPHVAQNSRSSPDAEGASGRRASGVSMVSPSSLQSYQDSPMRPSRFLEGSMNDRPSNQPPNRLISDMEAYERRRRENEYARRNQSTATFHHTNGSGNHTKRKSNFLRLGKTMIDMVNPVKVYQGLAEIWRDPEPYSATEYGSEARVSAVKAYEQYKRTHGSQSQQQTPRQGLALETPSTIRQSTYVITHPDTAIQTNGERSLEEVVQPIGERSYEHVDHDDPKRDSGVDVGGDGRTDGEIETPRPSVDRPNPRNSVSFQVSALVNLRKAKSDMHLRSASREFSVSRESLTPANDGRGRQANLLRKQPSKKDLIKQQKLSKKVSDLEEKLEAARRELHKALDDAPPVPPVPAEASYRPTTFTPGALPSLPSESLLSPQHFTPSLTGEPLDLAEEFDVDLLLPNQPSTVQRTSSQKRKHVSTNEDESYQPSQGDDNEHEESPRDAKARKLNDTSSPSQPGKRGIGRPRKALSRRPPPPRPTEEQNRLRRQRIEEQEAARAKERPEPRITRARRISPKASAVPPKDTPQAAMTPRTYTRHLSIAELTGATPIEPTARAAAYQEIDAIQIHVTAPPPAPAMPQERAQAQAQAPAPAPRQQQPEQSEPKIKSPSPLSRTPTRRSCSVPAGPHAGGGRRVSSRRSSSQVKTIVEEGFEWPEDVF